MSRERREKENRCQKDNVKKEMCNKRIVKVFLLLLALAASQVECKHQQSGNRRNRNSGKFQLFLNLIATVTANFFHHTHQKLRVFSKIPLNLTQICMLSWFWVLGKTLGNDNCHRLFVNLSCNRSNSLPRSLLKVRQLSLTYLCFRSWDDEKQLFEENWKTRKKVKRLSVSRDVNCYYFGWRREISQVKSQNISNFFF